MTAQNTVFKLTATALNNNKVRVPENVYEVLGDEMDKRYETREEAQASADELLLEDHVDAYPGLQVTVSECSPLE